MRGVDTTGYLATPRVRFRVGLLAAPVTSPTSGPLHRDRTQFHTQGKWREPHGGFLGNVSEACGGPGPLTAPLVQVLPGYGQRLQEQRSHLRLEPPLEHYRAVLVVIHVQRAAPMPALGLSRLGAPVHAPPAAHDPLDVGGRASA